MDRFVRTGRTPVANHTGGALQSMLFMLFGVALGVVLGVFVLPRLSLPTFGATTVALEGRTTVSEGELDAVLGTYVHDGERVSVSVREAIEESSSLDAVRNEDGTYDVPSVDTVLSLARNRLLIQDAEQHGLSVTEEDALSYAQETLGTQDISLVAANFNMGEEQTRTHLGQSALIKKLKETVVTGSQLPEPTPPTPPEVGKEDEVRPEYAQYIFALAGDEWDAQANGWTREDGTYRTQLRDFTVSNDGATYSAAQAAYEAACAEYATARRQSSTEWTAYVNGLLADVSVELSTLIA